MTILGNLYIYGGGSITVNLTNGTIRGKIIMAKVSGDAPRLNLTNTPVTTVEVNRPAAIEADAASPVTAVQAKAAVTVQGASTSVNTVTVPAGTADPVTVTVTGSGSVDVAVNSESGVAITTGNEGATVTVSSDLETQPDVTVGGDAVAHIHKWNDGVKTTAPTCTEAGTKTYTCTADGCTDPAATKTEAVPALGHTWNDGEVTKEPTETEDGVKTYTCTVCNETRTELIPAQKVWYSCDMSFSDFSIIWADAGLSSDETYGVNGERYGSSITEYLLQGSNTKWMDKTANETMRFEISKGTYTGGVYTVTEEIGELTLPLTVAEASGTITVTPQADGTYKGTGGNEGYDGYLYRIKYPDGTVMVGEFTAYNGTMSYGAPYEGCTIEVSQFKIQWGKSLGQGKNQWYTRYASIENFTITKPQSFPITTENLPVAPTEPVNVDNAADLKAALKKGGTVNLTADIQINEYMGISTGAPAVLNLNGHTITAGASAWFRFTDGKEITVNGTMEGSRIDCTEYDYGFGGFAGAKLTVNGGSYYCIGIDNAQEGTLNGVTIDGNDHIALWCYKTPKIVIRDCTIDNSGKDTSERTDMNIQISTVTIDGGTYDIDRIPARDDTHLTIQGGTFSFDPTQYLASGCTATKGATEEAPVWTVTSNP